MRSEINKVLSSVDDEVIATFKEKEIESILSLYKVKAEGIEKVKGNRKLKVLATGNNISVEEYASLLLKSSGWNSIHVESSLWNMTMYFLYFQVIWANEKPGDELYNDIPQDFYSGYEFWSARHDLIAFTTHKLLCLSKEEIKKFASDNIILESNRAKKFRVLTADPHAKNLNKENILLFIDSVPRAALLSCLLQLMKNQSDFRKGLPDLFAWNPIQNSIAFFEIKSTGDKFSKHQLYWVGKMHSLDIPVSAMRIDFDFSLDGNVEDESA